MKSGAAVNATNKSQSTPLHLAAKNGYYDVVQGNANIIKHISNCYSEEENNNIILDSVSELVEHGANVRAHDDKNKVRFKTVMQNLLCKWPEEFKSKNSSLHTDTFSICQR